MTISYNLGIPAAGNNPSVDQPDMRDNNDAIPQLIAIDHVNFGVSGSGEHLQVTFNGVHVPSLPTAATISKLFTNNQDGFGSNLPGFPNRNELFFYSGDVADSSSQYKATIKGSTMLLGGIIIKWGSGVANSGAGTPLSFASESSVFPNACFSVVLTPFDPAYSGSFAATAVTASGFTAVRTSGSGNTGYYYIAIGN